VYRGLFKVVGVRGEILGNSESVMILRFGPFVLDTARRQLRGDDGVRHLTPKAFALLTLLVREAPRVLTKQELHEQLWPASHVSDATLVGLVKEVRRALDDRDPDAPLIRTVHRVGYAFTPAASAPGPLVPLASASARHWLVFRGRRTMLGDGENIVGRDPASHVHTDHASVSRRHARITIAGSGVRIEDLGSKNGTTVGGERVADAVGLHEGDRCAFGSVVAIYRTSGSGASTETRERHRPRTARA